jgi:MFS transporter, DHA2 family, triacylglyceride efflux pump
MNGRAAESASPAHSHSAHPRLLLAAASFAVLISSADTYVIVVVLTSIMAGIGLDATQLQLATPIVSGFLLGYVVALPLLGRLSDLYGRRRILMACLLIFTGGSAVTATATTLAAAVVGRTLQGLGGGGLVPVTIALVADMWPAEQRGKPLGAVAAVQEFGSIIGPLFGALIVTISTWRLIFWINVPIAAAVYFVARHDRGPVRREGGHDWPGWLLLLVFVITTLAALVSPAFLAGSDTFGVLYGPVVTSGSWSALTTPIALAAVASGILFVIWEAAAPPRFAPLLGLRALPRMVKSADFPGATLVAVVLGCVVITFASADPSTEVLAPAARLLLPLAAVALAAFVLNERRTDRPLIRFADFADRAAFGSLLCNLAIGTALVAALVDIPIFAQATTSGSDQVRAALVLSVMLVMVPVGAFAGGLASHRLGFRIPSAGGMILCVIGFIGMANWGEQILSQPWLGVSWLHFSDLDLCLCGLGFGLAIAPVNAAMLAAVKPAVHGLASSLVVLARMVGMLCGISLLTAIGLHSFWQTVATIPSPNVLCPHAASSCAQYSAEIEGAIVTELHVIFAGAAIAAGVAVVLSAGLLRRRAVA